MDLFQGQKDAKLYKTDTQSKTFTDECVESLHDFTLEECLTETGTTSNDETDEETCPGEGNEDQVDNIAEDIPDEYDFSHGHRGKALIFTFTRYAMTEPPPDRIGADFEALNFKNLLECLGFNVEVHINKTTKEVKEIVKSGKMMLHSNLHHTPTLNMFLNFSCYLFQNHSGVTF